MLDCSRWLDIEFMEDAVEVYKHARKELGRHLVILTDQAWSVSTGNRMNAYAIKEADLK